jgi:phospholipase C
MALDPVISERIEHVVIVMVENRSFDHMLGYLGKSRCRLGDP